LLACGCYHFLGADGDVGTGNLMTGQQTHHRAEAGKARFASFTSTVLVILLQLLLLAEPATTVADLSEPTVNIHITAFISGK